MVGSGQTKAFLRSTSGQICQNQLSRERPRTMIELDAITSISQRPKPTQTSWIHIVLTYFIISCILPTSSYIFLHLRTSLPPSLMLHEISTGVHLSERQGAPVLICPVRRPTTKSAMKESWHDQLISFLQNPKKKTPQSHILIILILFNLMHSSFNFVSFPFLENPTPNRQKKQHNSNI